MLCPQYQFVMAVLSFPILPYCGVLFPVYSASLGATVLLEAGCRENSFIIKAISDFESASCQRDGPGYATVP